MTRAAILAGLFDDLADSYDHDHHEGIADALLARAWPGTYDAVADVACGAGAVALRLARARPDSAPPVLAVDISPRMIEAGRGRAVGGAVDWRVADAVPLPVPDGSLDAVFCASSLHFLGCRALADWRRVLRPGGRVAYSLPLAGHFRPSSRFAALLAADVPLPAGPEDAVDWAVGHGFTDVTAQVTVLGDRRVAITAARIPEHR
ncbi:methyltransferase domain-containing protein [Streptomyces sp. IBSBF 3010]|uniref:class I SAM-dependent methyltransferase n=1 Tax=unclassified Streptomyces TaxID=2593676 RepID=UPI002FDBCBED